MPFFLPVSDERIYEKEWAGVESLTLSLPKSGQVQISLV